MSDEKLLAGKNVLITGGARRLGAAIARVVAGAGARPVIHYNQSQSEAESLAADTNGWAVQADLAAPDAVEHLWAEVLAKTEQVDCLINNASIFPEQTLGNFTLDELEVNMRLHAWVPVALGRLLAGQGGTGTIVNLTDSRVTDYDAKHVPYHISKRALHDLTRMMALEFAPKVRVNAVAPGLVLPPEGKDDAYLEQLRDTNPMRAIGCPDDIADAVMFLLKSEFVTGQTIYVDGGRHMRGQVYG